MWDRRRKLKPEYRELSGDAIRDLRQSGTQVTDELRSPLVAYLGDSAPQGLDDCPAMFQAKVLICELTFLAPDHRREKRSGRKLADVFSLCIRRRLAGRQPYIQSRLGCADWGDDRSGDRRFPMDTG